MKHHHFHYSFTGGMGEGIQSVEGDFQPESAMEGALDGIRAAGIVGNVVLLGWQEMTPEQADKYRQFLAKTKEIGGKP